MNAKFSGLAIVGFIVGGLAIVLLWNTKARPIVLLIVVIILLGWVLRYYGVFEKQLHGAAVAIGGSKA
jgi:uncharacterized membrane protein YccC